MAKIIGGNTLYYPGCLTKTVLPDIQNRYEKILRQIGVDFIMLPDKELCCGSPVIKAGYLQDFADLKEKNLAIFKKYNVNRIITNCPACFNIFKNNYGLRVEHITEILVKKVSKIKAAWPSAQPITYHDPCHLGRYNGIYQEPRKILKDMGYQIAEFPCALDKSRCCGAGGGVKTNNPDLANKVANNVLSQVKTKKLVSPCPLCYLQFKENAPSDLAVLELSELIWCRN